MLSPEELEALLRPEDLNREEEEQALKLKVVLDFPLEVAVRVGNAERNIGEILKLTPGTVIELDRGINEPADLIINGRVVARGEIVIIDENFGVRITSILKPEERLEQLR
ncbi:MAG: flagellar motor switch protein FliN [Firmicutes bacterium]|nr:flagellar motor switch protein FliN [Bacillota bacterium]